ncbi:MAG TPA: hypothetical protein VGQ84_04105 [Gaiellaceae bacterium]|jgi:hypothetical protein|nr:hypothetical protein [Gaiellaceae bacterium]
MAKKKRSKKEISEAALREAENSLVVRRLREAAMRRMTPQEREEFLAEYRRAD